MQNDEASSDPCIAAASVSKVLCFSQVPAEKPFISSDKGNTVASILVVANSTLSPLVFQLMVERAQE